MSDLTITQKWTSPSEGQQSTQVAGGNVRPSNMPQSAALENQAGDGVPSRLQFGAVRHIDFSQQMQANIFALIFDASSQEDDSENVKAVNNEISWLLGSGVNSGSIQNFLSDVHMDVLGSQGAEVITRIQTHFNARKNLNTVNELLGIIADKINSRVDDEILKTFWNAYKKIALPDFVAENDTQNFINNIYPFRSLGAPDKELKYNYLIGRLIFLLVKRLRQNVVGFEFNLSMCQTKQLIRAINQLCLSNPSLLCQKEILFEIEVVDRVSPVLFCTYFMAINSVCTDYTDIKYLNCPLRKLLNDPKSVEVQGLRKIYDSVKNQEEMTEFLTQRCKAICSLLDRV